MAASADKGWNATAAVTLAAAGILSVAYIAQFGFGLWPCSLCYVQRAPYFVIVVLGALSLMPAVDARSRRIVLFHLAALLFLEAGLALYHTGVEMHWWLGPTACTGTAGALSMDDLTAALSKKGNPLCDEPAFLFLGISMAGYNAFAATVLGIAAVFAALRKPWWTQA